MGGSVSWIKLVAVIFAVVLAAARCGAATPAAATLPPKERLVQVWVNIGEDPRDWVAMVGANGAMISTAAELLEGVKAALADIGRAGGGPPRRASGVAHGTRIADGGNGGSFRRVV